MPSIEKFIGVVMALLMFGFIGGAVLVGLEAFGDSVTANSSADYAIGNITLFAENFAEQLPTAGTVLGALVIVAVIVIVLAGGYLAYQRYGGYGE